MFNHSSTQGIVPTSGHCSNLSPFPPNLLPPAVTPTTPQVSVARLWSPAGSHSPLALSVARLSPPGVFQNVCGAPPCPGPSSRLGSSANLHGRTKPTRPDLGHVRCQAGRWGTGMWQVWKVLSLRNLGLGELGGMWLLRCSFLRIT